MAKQDFRTMIRGVESSMRGLTEQAEELRKARDAAMIEIRNTYPEAFAAMETMLNTHRKELDVNTAQYRAMVRAKRDLERMARLWGE